MLGGRGKRREQDGAVDRDFEVEASGLGEPAFLWTACDWAFGMGGSSLMSFCFWMTMDTISIWILENRKGNGGWAWLILDIRTVIIVFLMLAFPSHIRLENFSILSYSIPVTAFSSSSTGLAVQIVIVYDASRVFLSGAAITLYRGQSLGSKLL
jgi:hypothetical protein